MKTIVLLSALFAGTATAASISGTVYDPSGGAAPKARITISNLDTGAQITATTGAAGEYAFRDLPGGRYVASVEAPGFAFWQRRFYLANNFDSHINAILNVGAVNEEVTVAAPGAAPADQKKPPSRIRVGGAVQAARLIQKKAPVYPESSKAQGIQGQVILRTVILKDGTPGEIMVFEAPDPSLADAAVEAVRQWLYSPTLLNGEPVEVQTDITVHFELRP